MTNLNIFKTNNELFYLITGNTYEYKDTIKNNFNGLWIPELKGWLIKSDNKEKIMSILNCIENSEVINLDPKILNKLIECKECNYKIPLHTLDTHYMFCGTYTIVVYTCKNGKILTADTFKYKETLKEYNGKFKKINGLNFWFLSDSDYFSFNKNVKNIDIIENDDDPIYKDLIVDDFDPTECLFD